MNKQLRNLSIFAILLLVALVVGTTYWQAWAESDLAAKQDNAIQRVAQFKIDRGDIKSDTGKPVALNRVLHLLLRERVVVGDEREDAACAGAERHGRTSRRTRREQEGTPRGVRRGRVARSGRGARRASDHA